MENRRDANKSGCYIRKLRKEYMFSKAYSQLCTFSLLCSFIGDYHSLSTITIYYRWSSVNRLSNFRWESQTTDCAPLPIIDSFTVQFCVTPDQYAMRPLNPRISWSIFHVTLFAVACVSGDGCVHNPVTLRWLRQNDRSGYKGRLISI